MKIILFLVAMLVIASCQPPQPTITAGSRADGTLEAKWTDELNLLAPDFALADADANIRCRNWGYAEAMPFSGYEKACIIESQYGGCDSHEYTKRYQCVGSPS